MVMEWDEVVDAARRSSWITYLGTADGHGRPHVAVVAPGFTPGTVWLITRASSKKAANLRVNREVALHWPVGNDEAPGELAAWGHATLHDAEEERRRVWDAGIMPYDVPAFFGDPGDPGAVIVEVAVRRARLQTQHGPRVWTP